MINNTGISFFSKPKIILGLYLLLAITFSFINYQKGQTKHFSPQDKYTHYNNYIIFKNSYFHLLEGKNLYQLFPDKQWDLYKYSPSFSALMMPLAYLPDGLGLLIWNTINVLILFFGVRYFIKGPPQTVFMLWFILNELVTSVINSQSNPLITGLLVAAFTFFEKDKLHWAALCIISTFYIKVFGILACLLFLFYPNKGKFVFWCLVWSILILLIPLLFTSPNTLIWQYQNWLHLLSNDHDNSYGYSFMGVLHTWLGINSGKDVLVLLGLLFLVLPFGFIKQFKNYDYRLNWFISLLLWLVIFNHKAESPTFIIAFTGIAIWLFSNEGNKVILILAILAFIFTSLAPTDLFPLSLRQNLFEPYAIKALPCIVIWFYLNIKLIQMGLKNTLAI
jgi:hypothetical protein